MNINLHFIAGLLNQLIVLYLGFVFTFSGLEFKCLKSMVRAIGINEIERLFENHIGRHLVIT